MFKLHYTVFLFFLFSNVLLAQDDDLIIKRDSVAKKGIIVESQGINVLAPSKAAFYSAIFPGGGQIYNKKYWKVPIVWAAVGTGVYAYQWNQNRLDRYQTAYKAEVAGRPHEFDGTNGTLLTKDGLERAQNFYKENRDLALFITIGLYALNILEANVDAHLPDRKLDTSLSFRPSIQYSPVTNQAVTGITLNYRF